MSFRVLLYRLLRLSLAKCPSDNTIAVVGLLWLDFIAPWRYVSVGADLRDGPAAAWGAYFYNNYIFYHPPVTALLDYVEVIGESFGEAVGRRGAHIDQDTVKSALMPLLLLTARVLSSLSPFSDQLRQVEADELAPPAAPDPVPWLRRPPSAGVIKEQLSVLECEKMVLQLLFDGAAKQRTLRILFWLEKIYAAVPGAESGRAPGISADAARLEGPVSAEALDLHSLIMQCEEELCAVFQVAPCPHATAHRADPRGRLCAVCGQV